MSNTMNEQLEHQKELARMRAAELRDRMDQQRRHTTNPPIVIVPPTTASKKKS
jgi:hypothetical protein